MMNKISIKRKLLLYNFFIQLLILVIFSLSLYKALEISTLDRLQTTLKVIILDIVNDMLEDKDKMINTSLNESEKHKFEPLYIRIIQIDNTLSVVNSTPFPSAIPIVYDELKRLKNGVLAFETKNNYIISRTKINIDSVDYIIEIATNNDLLNSTLKNLLYTLFFILPIVLILSTIGGYFLIYRSFLPVENILIGLKNIHAKDLSKRLTILKNSDEITLLTQEINSLLRRLEISFDKISQFSSDASHELKTPLTIIRGEIEVGLRRERTPKEYEKILQNSFNEILIIQRTIDDLLFLAQSEQQLNSTSQDDIYLDEIILEVVNELKSYSKLKSINIKCQEIEPTQILGYSKLLKIAIKNILKNAIAYSHKDSDIVIKNYILNGAKIISVEDFGIGIDKKEQEKIFEKFYRTDKSRDKNSGGTGLGMAMSQKIVSMHNGNIYIVSEVGSGTIVKIIF